MTERVTVTLATADRTDITAVYSDETAAGLTAISGYGDTYVATASKLPVAGAMALQLLWLIPSAEAAEPASATVISKSSSYDGTEFNGKIVARITIPDVDKAARICTGEELGLYRQFPGVSEASYQSGILRYILITPNIGPISVRDFGYSLSIWTDTSQQAKGITKVNWTNGGVQPAKNAKGEALTNFRKNDGAWTFKLVDPAVNLYEVTWEVTTLVNEDSLQPGSWAIPDSAIAAQSLKDAEKVMKTLAKLAR